MASSFPQLLRRSKFAAHDPLITRVYNSTPSSVHQHGDWGMKYPIHRTKGPKHISVNSLDTGTILGSDWRSAEKEARFVENWGRAGRWTRRDREEEVRKEMMYGGMPGDSRGMSYLDKYAERDLEAEHQAEEQRRKMEEEMVRIPDVNAMSKKEFERYIAAVRRERSQFLATKLEGMRETTRGAKEVEGGANPTLIGLASRGLASSHDPAHFQSTLTHREMESSQSDRIHLTPHGMHGLAYAAPSSSNPHVKGRVLNKEVFRNNYYANANASDNNRSHVVSVGGVTAELESNRTVRDNSRPLTVTDFTRADRSAGQHTFKIDHASLQSPPTVQYLAQAQRAAQWNNRGFGRPVRRSGAAQPSPLDTAGFTIKLSGVDAESTPLEPGSKEWVGREPTNRLYTSNEDRLGSVGAGPRLGSDRSDRTSGEMTAFLSRMQGAADRKANDKRIDESNGKAIRNLIDRLNNQWKAKGEEDGA